MSDHGVQTLIGQLREGVAELRRLRARGVEATELRHREREILKLQRHLALAVRDLFSERPEPQVRSPRVGGDAR